MTAYSDIVHLLARTTGNSERIGFPKLFLQFMGSYEGAAFLNQLVFWSGTKKDGWFYKTHAEWGEELFLSEYQVRRYTRQCEEHGFLETKVKKVEGTPTLHYRIDSERFLDSILNFLGVDSEIFSGSMEGEKISGSINILEQIKPEQITIPPTSDARARKNPSPTEPEAEGEGRRETAEASGKAHPKRPDSFREFVRAYERAWGRLPTALQGDEIAEWAERVPLEVWEYALKECIDRGKRDQWGYLRGILRKREQEGYTTTSPSPDATSPPPVKPDDDIPYFEVDALMKNWQELRRSRPHANRDR